MILEVILKQIWRKLGAEMAFKRLPFKSWFFEGVGVGLATPPLNKMIFEAQDEGGAGGGCKGT